MRLGSATEAHRSAIIAAFALLALLPGPIVACGSGASGGGASGSTEGGATGSSGGGGDGGGNAEGASGPGGDGGTTGSGTDAGASSDAGASGTSSATLSFVAGSAYSLYASVGGGTAHEVQLDTGSNGMFVPAATLGPGAQTGTTACSITYVSSGNTLTGHYVTAAVTLLGSTKTGDVASPPTTAPMSVCAVDDPTWGGGMMGVGFGRGSPLDPSKNVMLRMADIAAGTMHAGYVLSTHPAPHVQIGLTAAGSTGFQTLPLTPDPAGSGDWVASSLRGCLSLPGTPSFGAPCGALLVDTGVPECLLWGPADPTLGGVVAPGQTAVPAGTAMRIAAPADAGILDYAFVVGSGADTPSAVDIRTASAFSINTGRALLVDWDYLFDARQGLVGFRKAN